MAREVALTPLRQHEVKELVVSMLGTVAIPAGLLAAIFEGSRGNPFFIEELMKGLVDEDRICYREGRWQFREETLPSCPAAWKRFFCGGSPRFPRRPAGARAPFRDKPAGRVRTPGPLSGLDPRAPLPGAFRLEKRQLVRVERQAGCTKVRS